MNIFIFFFFCNSLIPVIMIVAGLWMSKNPPKKVNHFLGYRTMRSSMNQDTWDFAQVYAGKLWIKIGVPLLIISIVVQIPFSHSSESLLTVLDLIIMGIQLVIIIGSIFLIENKLKQTFNESGDRI